MKVLKILVLFLIVSCFISCEEDPTDVGKGLIPDSDKITLKVLDSESDTLEQSSEFFQSSLNLGSSRLVHIGLYDDIEAVALAKFNISIHDSLSEYLKNNQVIIDESWIEMSPAYTLGDTLGAFDFSLHQVSSDWSPSGFDIDSLDILTYEQQDLTSASKAISDTLITFDFDKNITLSWLDDVFDTVESNKGVLFLADRSINRIIGFPSSSSASSRTKLTVIYRAGGNDPDTIASYMSQDVYIVKGDLPQTNSNSIFVQGGLGFRSKIKFDLDKVPSLAIINRAELDIKINEAESYQGTTLTDTLRINILKNEESDSVITIDLTLLRKDSVYSGDIAGYIELLKGGFDNFGFLLKVKNETNYPNRIAIYGSDAASINRPKLKIYYTEIK